MARSLKDYVENNKNKDINTIIRVYREIKEGKVRLVDPRPPSSFAEYLIRPEYSLWMYTILAISALTIIAIQLSSTLFFIRPVRYILGLIYTLFILGYSLVELLFPDEAKLGNIERIALSLAASISLIPLIGLALNYTPWGITRESFTVTSLLLIVLFVLGASYRKYKIIQERNLVLG